MEGLLLRLSSLDADAENAVRVIGFFDRLIASRASLDAIVRKASGLAECPLGVSSSTRGLQVGGPIPVHATRRELEDGTVVWLARAGKPLPLDDMVLERFSIAVALSLELSRVPLPALGDPALVELALSDSAGEAERSRALHLLELKPTTPLRVLAVKGTPTGLSAALGPLHAVLATNEIPDQDGEVGISTQVPAINAPAAWAEARTALRFASVGHPAVRADDLGSQIALASLPGEEIAKLPDVIALDGLDPQLLTVLTALASTGSNRKAAAAIHRHHSTIPARIAQAEAALGFPIDTPEGRFRLHLALVLRHLRDN
ncbi:PucR family transcriptional regulator [Kibdelosporangium aridum]|uniref:PucR family transcriptional regulator n=1 Tax=Kibdelosporangium aridum TaxID=2030 RepID=A0A428YQ46_KIBAR|nr:helix-turn-helix domain-containing protein [Kibdelosporangium aridum]RSM70516.1 PucR family transcriptional regulator [Kibdelosporangium aridum]